MANPPVNWGYARRYEGFLHLITQGQFERPTPTSDVGRFISELWLLAGETVRGFGWVQFALALLPLFLRRRAGPGFQKFVRCLFSVLICTGPVMIASFNPSPYGGNPSPFNPISLLTPRLIPWTIGLSISTGLGLILIATGRL